MKKTTIKFEYSEEKLVALESYLAKKDTDLDTELEDIIEKLYEKFVPTQVREFIEVKEKFNMKKGKKTKSKQENNNATTQKETVII